MHRSCLFVLASDLLWAPPLEHKAPLPIRSDLFRSDPICSNPSRSVPFRCGHPAVRSAVARDMHVMHISCTWTTVFCTVLHSGAPTPVCRNEVASLMHSYRSAPPVLPTDERRTDERPQVLTIWVFAVQVCSETSVFTNLCSPTPCTTAENQT